MEYLFFLLIGYGFYAITKKLTGIENYLKNVDYRLMELNSGEGQISNLLFDELRSISLNLGTIERSTSEANEVAEMYRRRHFPTESEIDDMQYR